MGADVHYCQSNEIHEAMNFLENHWKQGHILAHDLTLMNFQHQNMDGSYNIALSGSANDKTGFLGFIPTSHFDPTLAAEKDTWLAIWKNVGEPGDGLALFNEVISYFDTVGSIGINSKVAKLYRILGFQLGELSQYYILNRECKNFRITDSAPADSAPQEQKAELVLLHPDEMKASGVKGVYHPLKSLTYFDKRYVKHPYYKYLFLGVRNPGDSTYCGIIVVRPIHINGSCCLRIVDVLGDMDTWESIAGAIQLILEQTGAEYIDCLNYGLEESIFLKHGFLKVDEEHIIPNYFEPLLRENITIKLAILNKKSVPYIVFKGDSDQDRPNQIKKGN